MSRPSYDARMTRPTSSHLSREYSSADAYTLSKDNPSDAELRSSDRSPQPPACQSRATASSATSTSTPRISTYQDADEEDDEDEGGWTTTYDDFVPRRASTMYHPGMGHIASSTSKTNVLETVQQPILATHDWAIGEKRTDWGKRGSSRGENPRAVPPLKAKVKRVKGFVGRHWKWLLAIVLALIVVVALILYFLLPRVPGVDFQGSNPIIKTSTVAQTSSSPAFFYFTSDLLVNIDASASYIPIIFSMFQVQLSLQETGKIIAQGPRTGIKVNGKTSTIYQIPMTWSGNMSVSEPTFKAVRQACQTIYPTTTRPGLNLTMSVKTKLIGLIGTYHTHPVSIDDVPCPIQFPGNSS